MTNYGAELDELVAMLEDVGLIDPYVSEDGEPALRLTESGTALGERWRWAKMLTLERCWMRCSTPPELTPDRR